VQPSVYGTENSCTLDALRRLGPRARGVAVIDSSTPDEELEKMKGAGVRGVRVNLQTGGGVPALIEEAAARAAALGWHVQTFARIALLRRLKPLPVPLVVDHFGLPESIEDVRYLALLLRQGNSYVKLSGPHHPFTRGARDPSTVQPFDPIDDAAALERLHGWVGDAALFRKILVDNPARLYDF
jgi:predicted TIM-barrel fold metal-dependent hydrolase